MWGKASFLIFLAAATAASPAFAQDPMRRQFLPYVLASTDCLAKEVLAESGSVQEYARSGSVLGVLEYPARRCGPIINSMIAAHDSLYGYGTGRTFYDGPYLQDVNRAILSRVRPELERRRVEFERIEADRQAEVARRDTERRLELARLETERQAEAARQERVKRVRVEEAERARDLLRERFYECTSRQLLSLVRSGEQARVLASAATTLCSSDLNSFMDAALDGLRAQNSPAPVTQRDENVFRETAREKILENVTATAVQAKAAYIGNGGGG